MSRARTWQFTGRNRLFSPCTHRHQTKRLRKKQFLAERSLAYRPKMCHLTTFLYPAGKSSRRWLWSDANRSTDHDHPRGGPSIMLVICKLSDRHLTWFDQTCTYSFLSFLPWHFLLSSGRRNHGQDQSRSGWGWNPQIWRLFSCFHRF